MDAKPRRHWAPWRAGSFPVGAPARRRRASSSLLRCSARKRRPPQRRAIPDLLSDPYLGAWLKRRPPPSRTPALHRRTLTIKTKRRRRACRPLSSTGGSLKAFSASKRLGRPATTWGALSTLSLIAVARSEPLSSILAVFSASAPARSPSTGARCILTRRRRERSSSI